MVYKKGRSCALLVAHCSWRIQRHRWLHDPRAHSKRGWRALVERAASLSLSRAGHRPELVPRTSARARAARDMSGHDGDHEAAAASSPSAANDYAIPRLLTALRDEYDALVRERHALVEQLEQTRDQLAAALLRNEAATRVVERLLRERAEAEAGGDDNNNDDNDGGNDDDRKQGRHDHKRQRVTLSPRASDNARDALPSELARELTERQQRLMAARQARQKRGDRRGGAATADALRGYAELGTPRAVVGARVVDIRASPHEASAYLTVDGSGSVRVWKVGRQRCVRHYSALPDRGVRHVSAAWMPPSLPASSSSLSASSASAASATNFVAGGPVLDRASGGADFLLDHVRAGQHAHTVKLHGEHWREAPLGDAAAVQCARRLAPHESGRMVGVAAGAGWHLVELERAREIASYACDGARCIAMHGDGLLCATNAAAEGGVALWDLRMRARAAILPTASSDGDGDGDSGDHASRRVTQLEFAANGYQLAGATGGEAERVASAAVWDLRKLAVSARECGAADGRGERASIAYDLGEPVDEDGRGAKGGSYLAIAMGERCRVFRARRHEVVAEFDTRALRDRDDDGDGKESLPSASAVALGLGAKYLFTSVRDRGGRENVATLGARSSHE